jgi:DNA-binding MarR family transcriptional regulator
MSAPASRLAPDLAQVAQLRVAVARLNRRLRQQTDTDLPLTLQSTLVSIEQHGPLSLGELAGHERISPATVTKIIRRLTDDGLVTRSPDPDDGRVVRVAITSLGQQRLADSRQRRNAWLATRLGEPGAPSAHALRTTVEVLEALARTDDVDGDDS